MSLDLLDAPLRVTWQVATNDRHLSPKELDLIAHQLLDNGVFFVQLLDSPLEHPAIADLLSSLVEGCQVSLVCCAFSRKMEKLQPGWSNLQVFLDVSPNAYPFDSGTVLSRIEEVRGKGYEPALVFYPSSKNIPYIQDVAEICRCAGITRLKLPNRLISDSLDGPHVRHLAGSKQVEQFRRLVSGDPESFRRGIEFEIHDLFLWEILYPRGGQERSEYGGCQAGNSLAHISADGVLFPCSSWPLPMGSLLEERLLDLWQSPLRFQIRETVGALPTDCRRCQDLPNCLGGCRGLAETYRMASKGRDLMCCGPR